MKVAFKSSFAKDLRKINNRQLKARIKAAIEQVEQAESLLELPNLKQIKGDAGYFRIRVGNYRVGLLLQDDILYFVRFLHRKDIYRYFP